MTTFLMIVLVGAVIIGIVYAGIRQEKTDRENIPEVICTNTNCGYRGKPGREKQRSTLVFVFLFCMWILPGIVYAILVPRYRYWCPQCQMKLTI